MEKIIQDKRIVLAILIGLSFLVYLNSLQGAFVIDDRATILKNPFIGDPGKYLTAPPSFTLSINYLLGKDNPFVYHLTNLLFHIGVVILVYLFFLEITSQGISFLGATIFAVHPINTEVVNWISARPYVLGTVFITASLLFYVFANKEKKRFYFYYLASLVFFILAFFSNNKLIIFLLILGLYELCFGKISQNWKKLIPYFVLTLLFIYFLFQPFQARIITENPEYMERPLYYNPLRQIPTALSSYLELFVWPINLTFYHEDFTINFWLRVGVALLLFGGLVYFYRKQKLLFFGLAFFVFSLLTTLLPIRISFVVAERYVYFGSIGLCLVLAWVLVKGLKKYPQVLFLVSGILIVLLSIRTVIRNRDWRTRKNLWLATTRVSATSSVPWNNLGDVYSGEGNYQLAIRAFQQTIRLNPTHLGAHHNLGVVYLRMGDFDQAIIWFERAIAINPLPQTYNELGVTYLQKREFDKAEKLFRKMIELAPEIPVGYNSLGILFAEQGRVEEARQAWEKVLELDPSAEAAKRNLMLLEQSLQPSP